MALIFLHKLSGGAAAVDYRYHDVNALFPSVF